MIFDMLGTKNSFISDAWLYCNKQINDECMKSLGEYIKSNKCIEEISLDSNKISDTGIEVLVPYLDDNTTFKQLYLSDNKGITDKSIPYLIEIVSRY